MSDPFDLERFRRAQDEGGTYERALEELRAGRKQSHWIWFVFPQLEGLGRSDMARRYAIGSLREARAYLADELLGGRLRACARLLAERDQPRAEELLGSLDALKLRSSMTLFALAAPEEPVFRQVIERHFEGQLDPATEGRLGA